MSKKHVIFLITLFFIGLAGLTYYFNCSSSEELIDCDTNIEKESEKTSDILNGESSNDKILNYDAKEDDLDNSSTKDSKISTSDEKGSIYIHICGEVREPGVYELKKKEARVIDAIEAAKGLTKKASLWAVNQAELVIDGQQIYIPSKDEVTKDVVSNSKDISKTDNIAQDTDSTKVNINIASEKELITLPGIGQAKARKIIDYRESNGRFSKIEDIMNIPGIKEGLFNKISENITI